MKRRLAFEFAFAALLAIHEVLESGRCLTRDLGGDADTATFTHALIDALQGE